MSNHTNIVRIKSVNNALQELRDHVVFVGGSTISMYADLPVLEIRPTDDVDVIVEILNYNQRQHLEERLREIGFVNDIGSKVTCRFKIEGIVVDIMPTDDPSIGFKNIWYPKGYQHAENYTLDDGQVIRILTAPYFIATKLEAFKGRGHGDGRMSHDFEDIVFIMENRAQLWAEMAKCDDELKEYLISEFSALMNNPSISEWIESHVERSNKYQQTTTIIENIKAWLAECKGDVA